MNPPTDLTQRPPRSPRVKLGGYVVLPRMLDKGRGELAGKAGDYHFACPMDQMFLEFAGLESEAILALLKEGKSDTEVLAWIREHSKRQEFEIFSWSEWMSQRAAANNGSREMISELVRSAAPDRDDVASVFDMLDLDDFVSYGGKA